MTDSHDLPSSKDVERSLSQAWTTNNPKRKRSKLTNGESDIFQATVYQEDGVGEVIISGWDDVVGNDNAAVNEKSKKLALAGLSFGEEVGILCITQAHWRLICYFLQIQETNDVGIAIFREVRLITLLASQSIQSFMKSKEWEFSGELSFDQYGNPIPVSKTNWKVSGKDTSFTSHGFIFFENKKTKEKIVFSAYESPEETRISCFSNKQSFSQEILSGLIEFTKSNNCLRGLKLKDIDVYAATFDEVDNNSGFTWDKFYYEDNIRNLFELEVFGFLDNIEKYNRHGISKRGIMLYGPPGTGKTSLGKIICNYAKDKSVIWITPDVISENTKIKSSVKVLYKLAEYLSPVVVFLEDLDLFTEDRSSGLGDTMRLGALMNILDGVNTISNAITIASTNRLELIEKALRNRPGRFDRLVEISSLNKELRKKMFMDRFADATVEQNAMDTLINKTEGWTGAECEEFVKTANLRFINDEVLETKEARIITLKMVNEMLEIMTKFKVGGDRGPGNKAKSIGFATEV